MLQMIKCYVFTIFLCFVITVQAFAQQMPYPPDVATVLKRTRNKNELEKALQYFYKQGNTESINAINFLVANSPFHSSFNYFWANNEERKIPFDEKNYPNYLTAFRALDSMKTHVIGLHPVGTRYYDADTLTAAYLIDAVSRAIAAWKRVSPDLSFEDFCEFLLPYRTDVEPLQNWRKEYENRFSSISESVIKNGIDATVGTILETTSWFSFTADRVLSNDPLPRLGPLDMLFRKEGACYDMVNLQVYALRSQGIAAATDIIPFWATSTGSHYLSVIVRPNKKVVVYNTASNNFQYKKPPSEMITREPGKVLRTTFSAQKGAIAYWVEQDQIPFGVLRNPSYIDVTTEYWPVQDVTIPLLSTKKSSPYVFACVHNGGKWRPVWWGRKAENTVTFTNMSKGAVYMPMYYENQTLKAAGYPMAVGGQHTLLLQPDTLHVHNIQIKSQEQYLKYRDAKKYSLYYWNNKWVLLKTQTAGKMTEEMIFEKVPKNALLLLVPEYSQGKERPFIITDDGERVWF
jgi:hypothetical protein